MNAERLEKLAAHLEGGKLGQDGFDFNEWHSKRFSDGKCFTVGCALGECPHVFPDDWYYNDRENPVLKGDQNQAWPQASAMHFFDIDDLEAMHLFIPWCQLPGDYGGQVLNDLATPQQVAENIRAFINIKSKW